MREIVLVLDTSSREEARLGIFENGEILEEKKWSPEYELSATFYKHLEEIFKKTGLRINDCTGLVAVLGPGSFTGLRIGLSIFNGFSYALKIKTAGVKQVEKLSLKEIYTQGVKELKDNQILTPFYDREPNITKPKQKF